MKMHSTRVSFEPFSITIALKGNGRALLQLAMSGVGSVLMM